MDKDDKKDSLSQEELVQTKVIYAYGVLMERGDRLIDEKYEESLLYFEKANKLFLADSFVMKNRITIGLVCSLASLFLFYVFFLKE